MPEPENDADLGPEQRDGRPVEERADGQPEDADEDVPDDETIESVGY
jgi:hypothetical protein